MRKLVSALLMTLALTACSGMAVGPVDTSGQVNPGLSDGSVCGGR
jgi:hypothetical protein